MQVKARTANQMLQYMVLWPAALLALLLWLYSTYSQYQNLLVAHQDVAQRMADLLAIAASHSSIDGQDFSVFEQQVSHVVTTPIVNSVRFVDLRPETPAQNIDVVGQDRVFVQRYAPVELLSARSVGPMYELTGYIEVTVDLRPQIKALQIRSLQQLIAGLTMWFALLMLVRHLARSTTLPLKRMIQYTQQVGRGEHLASAPMMSKPSPIEELNVLSVGLEQLAAHFCAVNQMNQDLTRENQQLKQREQRALASREDFQSMITHELKSPLNAIWGGAQLLRADESMSTSQRDHLAMIEEGSRYLARLLDQVLALVNLEQGRVSVHIEAFDPINVLQQLMSDTHVAAEQKKLRILLDIQHEARPYALDSQKIRQVLIILLDNAIKFSEHGDIHVSAWVESHADQKRWCCSVKDQGIGVDPALHLDIFKPFFQVDSSSNRQHEGAGMGLALAQRLMSMMNGQITVRSQLGQGACFTLCSPVHLWDEVRPEQQLEGRHVIMFETGLAGEAVALLQTCGLHVHRATSAEQVSQLCQQHTITAVFVCSKVSELALTPVLAFLRRFSNHYVVVIQLTTQADFKPTWSQKELGIDHWLIWPVSRHGLVKQLLAWLS